MQMFSETCKLLLCDPGPIAIRSATLCDHYEMTLGIGKAEAVATITRRAADRIRAGYLWIYRSDLENAHAEIPGGALVSVVDSRGIPPQAFAPHTLPARPIAGRRCHPR